VSLPKIPTDRDKTRDGLVRRTKEVLGAQPRRNLYSDPDESVIVSPDRRGPERRSFLFDDDNEE